MCVRELRAESPNVSVFYMAWVSLIAAIFGCFVTPLLGFTHTFRMPSHWAEWTLLAGIGAPGSHPAGSLYGIAFSELHDLADWV